MFPGEPEGATDSAGNAVIPASNGSVDEMGTSHLMGELLNVIGGSYLNRRRL